MAGCRTGRAGRLAGWDGVGRGGRSVPVLGLRAGHCIRHPDRVKLARARPPSLRQLVHVHPFWELRTMIGVYEDHGIRFEYPPAWEVEEDDEGPVTTVSVHAPDGMAFALVRID